MPVPELGDQLQFAAHGGGVAAAPRFQAAQSIMLCEKAEFGGLDRSGVADHRVPFPSW
jgi:hypothetical protein